MYYYDKVLNTRLGYKCPFRVSKLLALGYCTSASTILSEWYWNWGTQLQKILPWPESEFIWSDQSELKNRGLTWIPVVLKRHKVSSLDARVVTVINCFRIARKKALICWSHYHRVSNKINKDWYVLHLIGTANKVLYCTKIEVYKWSELLLLFEFVIYSLMSYESLYR